MTSGPGAASDAAPPLGLTIGLTGGIGSGKSLVARRLATLGAIIVDTDAIAHRLTAPGGAAIDAVRHTFGADAIGPDGAMDRAHMRQVVFADPGARKQLEAILHPMIGQATWAAAQAAPEGSVVVFDVPLLVESGRWVGRVDRILVVDCEVSTQVQRVMARNGWDEPTVRRIIGQQASREARLAVADDVILNDGLDIDHLHATADGLWAQWQPLRRPIPR